MVFNNLVARPNLKVWPHRTSYNLHSHGSYLDRDVDTCGVFSQRVLSVNCVSIPPVPGLIWKRILHPTASGCCGKGGEG